LNEEFCGKGLTRLNKFREADVSKKGETESRPYRIRTCDTLIKRYKSFVPGGGKR